ncbi:B-lymphocyte antigen CD20 [Choloepus didactylus]|uniref:B-lymphocyte antigen CD20 n=1 Tax=Choloepus didactylus TaxID=27675 RepID=UPI00189C7DB1|nr:B-lymphocyte antigen CD20 [Choloepus didactylus]
MATPRNSMSGTFPAEPMKGPVAMQPVQKTSISRASLQTGVTQTRLHEESKALGAVQIMNGLFHIALGGILMVPMGMYAPICVIVWYPSSGEASMYIISGSLLAVRRKTPTPFQVKGKMVMNSLSLFTAISGIIFIIMDIFNITMSHFFKMESPNLIRTAMPYINIYNCEPSMPFEKNATSTEYCYNIRSVFLGILAVMLIFSFFQKLVAGGIAENDWRTLCSKPKANIVLLSAEDKKEQVIEIKEEVVELTETSSQPKNEDDVEIIPVQEEVEETEINFPEPPEEQESSPIENDSSP